MTVPAERRRRARPHVRTPVWALVALAVAAVVFARLGHGRPAPGSQASVSYTCCRPADIDPVFHPGQTMLLHWTVTVTRGAATGATGATGIAAPTRLDVQLSGPYAAAGAKGAGAPVVARAPQLLVTGREAAAPVSRLRIPAGAAPGYYQLRTATSRAGDRVAGTATVRVAG